MRKNRYLARANSDFKSGQYDKAEVEYLKVLRVAPRNPVALARLGFIYYDQGRGLRAPSALQRAAPLAPEHPVQEQALTMLAEAAFSRQDVQDTLQQIEGVRQGDKDRAGYRRARATLL